MIALTTAVAIAVTCSVIFMVSAVVITIIWIKIRQERRSLALIKARQGPYAHGLQSFPVETLTELSREEGSALRQYGQLPYGRPTEWGLLASRESLTPTSDDKSPIELLKKRSLSLKRSLSSLSKGHSRNLTGPGSLTTLTEASEGPYSQTSPSREDLIISAVDGALELPTETTPRQTPEREEEPPSTDNTIRPNSGAWPLIQQRERSSALFPVFEDHHEGFDPTGTRVRGGSITSQTAGVVPDQPVPPPPCAYPPNRFRLSKNDSMRFSSVSLETADSSILDDSRRTSANADTSLVSPALPPCPTFAPFSANDVGRECDRRSRTANVAPFVFPANSPARKGQKVESERASPRRSLTACSPTRSSERVSAPPRRSESLSAKQSRDEPRLYLDMDRIPPLNTTSRNTALLPHFSQMQRHSMHGSPRRDNDPFYNGTGPSHSLTYSPYAPGRRASSFLPQDMSPQSSNGHPKPPLASALKGSGHRKGHRRQNCVRISIHPPITFPGPSFSPMVEEPEEVEEVDRSEISNISNSNVSRNSSVSAMSTTNRNSFLDDRPISRIIEDPIDLQPELTGSPFKKIKRHTQHESTSTSTTPTATVTTAEKALPGILTSLPTTTDNDSLSHTPSPERNPPVWNVSYQSSPTQLENSPVPGSPRRSAVMGPRSQPGKPARNSYQSLIPPEDNKPPSPQQTRAEPQSSPPARSPPRNHSIKDSSRNQSAQYSLRRVKSEAREQTQTQTPPRGQRRKRASHYTISTTTSANPQSQTMQPPQKTPGTQISAVVPIWEDQKQTRPRSQSQSQPQSASTPRRSTVSLVYDPPILDSTGTTNGETSPRRNQADRMARMASYRNARQGCVTPARKAVGLGIGPGAATPGSLYDGEGFLKE
ncbi:hypothetical protein BJY01DRAFT_262614 [Aspergillus pseudoustus]|uniref:Uncharacterized protein n=1 Tax=Aspergillus pseudoustus TaxID=1810923 RepID=A0ABR4K889_9EURO